MIVVKDDVPLDKLLAMLVRRAYIFFRDKAIRIFVIFKQGFRKRLDEIVQRRVEKLERVANYYMLF